MRRSWMAMTLGCGVLCFGCDDDASRGSGGPAGLGTFTATATAGGSDTDGAGTSGPGGGSGGSDGGDSSGFGDDGGDGPKFDLGDGNGSQGADTDGCGTECECTIPEHQPCDANTGDPFLAMGLGCPGELAVQVSTTGPAPAIGVRTGFGANNTFSPREGSAYAVIGSGFVSDLDLETPPGDSNLQPTHCNDDLGAFDVGGTLPLPLRSNNVAGDCTADPALLGTGDCSNTIAEQFNQGNSANDYVEMRFELDVPVDVVSLSYDFAFFSTEYPDYFGSQFNDMYVGWLESEAWTGNISFDAAGNPISLNAGFLDYRDDANNLPEFAGTCMRQHAGTGWLTSSAGVVPGEHITVAFAIFDLSDSILDSYVFLDNFQWGCEPGAPSTMPEG
ncbi:MAG: choice-of-anchor L domain-containing protein [Myxococcota bacterium]